MELLIAGFGASRARRTTGASICALCHEEDSNNTRRQTGSSDRSIFPRRSGGVEKRWPFPFPSRTYAIYRARLLPAIERDATVEK